MFGLYHKEGAYLLPIYLHNLLILKQQQNFSLVIYNCEFLFQLGKLTLTYLFHKVLDPGQIRFNLSFVVHLKDCASNVSLDD